METETNSFEDIVIDILSRLPVKSVKRFKCVSRSWNKLISDPYFKRKHLNHHQAKNQTQKVFIRGSYFQKDTYSFYTASLSPRQIVKDVQKLDSPSICVPGLCRIHSSCDGLFLIGIYSYSSDKDRIFLLWNPSTRESRLLPRQNTNIYDSLYGLGYDSTSDDYKVFKVEYVNGVPNEILSLKSDSWRTIHPSRKGVYLCKNESMAFVHGAFHWLISTTRVSSWLTMISFDVSNEIYGEVPLPEQMFMPYMFDQHFTVLEGMLSINCLYGDKSPLVDIWVMKDYGVKESWTKLFSLQMEGPDMLSIKPVVPRYIFENGEVLLKCGRIAVLMTSSGSIELRNIIRPLVSDEDIGNDIVIGMGGDGLIGMYGDDGLIGMGGYVYTESLISPE